MLTAAAAGAGVVAVGSGSVAAGAGAVGAGVSEAVVASGTCDMGNTHPYSRRAQDIGGDEKTSHSTAEESEAGTRATDTVDQKQKERTQPRTQVRLRA
jgi:autotransporter adhesin